MKTRKILVIHGPNLNLLGDRETDLYGNRTLESIDRELADHGAANGFEVSAVQFNDEGRIVTAIQDARKTVDGIVINPAAYTHTSVAILDALRAVAVPTVEIHLTNIFAREPARRVTVTGEGVDAVIAGLGPDGYRAALDALIRLIEARATS